MEDGWVFARSLKASRNNVSEALSLFNKIRLPYYSRMYAHLAEVSEQRELRLRKLGTPSAEECVRNKVISLGGQNMQWIYGNHIGKVWNESVGSMP